MLDIHLICSGVSTRLKLPLKLSKGHETILKYAALPPNAICGWPFKLDILVGAIQRPTWIPQDDTRLDDILSISFYITCVFHHFRLHSCLLVGWWQYSCIIAHLKTRMKTHRKAVKKDAALIKRVFVSTPVAKQIWQKL